MKFSYTEKESETKYPKLVRDKIPLLYKKRTGKEAKIFEAKNKNEFIKFLLKKVVEEAKELEYSLEVKNTKEEIADILEIIEELIKINNWKLKDIKKIQKSKRVKNGGFKKRIILLEK